MFHGDRWARVFVATLGENAESGLLCLKALVPPLREVPRVLSGYPAARWLEKMLRESIGTAGSPGGLETVTVAEPVIRFMVLLVEKGRFRHINVVMEKIEERIDTQKGVLAVTLESAAPLDGAFAEEFGKGIAEKIGVAKIKMKTRLVPELLGGYRLQIGEFYVDASLRGQVEKMKADLEGAALACSNQAQGNANDGF